MLKKITAGSAAFLVFLVCFSCIGGADSPQETNLFKDPSFETTQSPDQFGHVFPDWAGWVYETPGRLAMGTVARTGKYSYELVGDKEGKVRLQSQRIKLQPGRYRVKAFVRGLSVGPGPWRNPMDFSVGFDGKFPILKKTGTFGWTPITYVFQIDKPIDNFQLLVGLLGGGWLWIDDASLVKVGPEVALTPEPVLGSEERPFAEPGAFAAGGVTCPECGFHAAPGNTTCRACGHAIEEARQAAPSALPPVKVIADFENGKTDPFTGGTVLQSHASRGRFALAAKQAFSLNKPQDWSGYDEFRFDVFNPSDTPVPLLVEIRDTLTRGYWSRVNYDTVAPPGRSTITIPTSIYVGEKSRPGRSLLKSAITSMFLTPKGGELFFDAFRLERLDSAKASFKGLLAYDFGPMDSPVMEGFQQVTASMPYEPERGFGWEKADLWRSFNALQPDALFQDFICPRGGSFRVDLPNGRYRVLMNIDSPGGYWGEPQVYDRRRVTANGSLVVDEKMDFKEFKNRYFRNAHHEDLPGINTFNDYVQRMFQVKEFDVEVRDSRLDLKFEGQGFAIALSSLVIYPSLERARGDQFWSWVTSRRRAQFNDYFNQVLPKRTGSAAPAEDYALFARNFMKTVNAFDGPTAGEGISSQGLALSVAQGEEGALTFSLQPSGDPGEISLKISDLAYQGKSPVPVPPLPAAVLNPGWLDYRINRVTMEGSVYSVSPRYWHPLPAPAAPGVTRTFWLRVKTPAGVHPGAYRAQVTVMPHLGKPRSFPVTVTVLPFTLDPITDLAVGPFGANIDMPWPVKDPKADQWFWQSFAKSLDVIKQAGCTSFSGVPHLKFTGKGGKIILDTALADKEMALIRSKGFSRVVSSYGVSTLGYRNYGDNNGADLNAARSAGFPDAVSFLTAVYRAVDEHALANNWLPVAWNLCDEPLGEAVRGAALNAWAHRQAAQGLKLTTFMGATSLEGDDPKNSHVELVKALLMPTLANHDEKSLQLIEEAGNTFAYYNGATRWKFGRYMKMLVLKHRLTLRLVWHFNVAVGDPYYALDCREDDYCWYNTDADQTMVPSVNFLGQILPGLNDYRYLSTLQRKVAELPGGALQGKKLFEELMFLKAGVDRDRDPNPEQFEQDRSQITAALLALDAK